MRMFWSAALVAAAVLLCSSTFAVEVKQRVEIEGDMDEVWAKFGGWCAISQWHPAVAKCEEAKDGAITRRTLILKDGGVIKETMTQSGKHTYSYVIDESPLPVANYSATLSAAPDDDDEEEVNIVWTATFDAKGAKDEEAAKVIQGIFKAGLDSIKKMYK